MHAWKSKQTKTLATLLRLARPRPRALRACPLSPFSTLCRPLLSPLSRLFEMLLVLPVVVETFFSPSEPLEWGCGVGEGGEGGGQLTFRLSGLERKGLRSLTEARELLLLLRRLAYGASACAQNPRSGLRGRQLFAAGHGPFCLVLLNFIGGPGGGRVALVSPEPHLCLRPASEFDLFFEFPIFGS